MNRGKPGERGWTLLELVVTMVIVGVMAAVALPNYATYIARGNRAEARIALLEASHWMERWRTERGRYDDPGNPGNPPPGFPWVQAPIAGSAKYGIAVDVTAATYTITATATGSMAGDVCATLSIDHTGARSFTGIGGTRESCWNR